MLRDDLLLHLKSFPTAPFLFVGSGMSRRYLGLDDWEGLLRRFAEPTGRRYARFRSEADGSYPDIATKIAKAFNTVWFESDEFADSRAAHEDAVTRLDSPLKLEISRHLE